ncbi:MAG: hypothetical protein EPN61_12665 [Burkholderiaceae bacterium]|nr:MAG: hypothetical protein EPN61_12665 [Burkholderiaceae bacterium]
MKRSLLVGGWALIALAALLLGACAGGPKTPDWQMNAHDSMQRAIVAYLSGDARGEVLEFAKARSEIASTGRPDLVARAELLRCAARVASLVFEPCARFEKLREDAPAAERAYADYLSARVRAQDVALLPAPQQVVAGKPDVVALGRISDPLSQLVAAGVVFERGQAGPAVMALAVQTASAQGWRRPLLAWLTVQARAAEQGGDGAEAARLRRRIDLVQNATP